MTITINIMTKIFFPWTAQDALLSLAEQLLDVYECDEYKYKSDNL